MFANKEDVTEALLDESVSVENVLPPISYEGAHITGSANLNCLEMMNGMDSFVAEDKITLLVQPAARYKRVITYCGGGIAAAFGAMAHVMAGQENIAVYDGSLYEWIGEGMPVTGNGKWEFWKIGA